MTGRDFLLQLADQLARDLTANAAIRRFTTNTALIGAFAEASVRQLVRRIVEPLHVSRGAIIYESICPENVPEIDTIIWRPMPMPPVFEAGEFALIPRGSALGFLEIKRSNYDRRIGELLVERLAREDELIPIHSGEPDHAWKDYPGGRPQRALGVICLHEHSCRDDALDELLAKKRAVVLLERVGDEIQPNPSGMYALVNYLVQVRLRARILDGLVSINRQE